MWCKSCNIEIFSTVCDICGKTAEPDMPSEVYWCDSCSTPIIRYVNEIDRHTCPLCSGRTDYLCADLRPVFPEERLLVECLVAKPLAFHEKAVWACDNRYYIDGKSKSLPRAAYGASNIAEIIGQLKEYKAKNTYDAFEHSIERFVKANQLRLTALRDEAFSFVRGIAAHYSPEATVISFSGGKDSTVTQDIVVRALGDPSLVHIYGDTTLELPMTATYVSRFKGNNPKAIIKTAKNKEQDFYRVCEDIGPPARMMRWCCSMFKTGPITRVITNLYRDREILTYYGIRKYESVSRSKYNRIDRASGKDENGNVIIHDRIKIQKQTVASPIFFWKDLDVWLYILGEKLDFNDAYRLGYDRVGCWCCPNNNERAQFLSRIYTPDQWDRWHSFLVDFAKRIGKPDAEVYVDTGKWKARQGGNGVASAENIKLKFTNCTAEEDAKIYQLYRPLEDSFYELFCPFGKVSRELGRKLIGEILVLDLASSTPILAIQPFKQDGYEYAVKVKTMNVKKHEDLQRMVGYQVRKYNACRKCLKCESLCKYGAIAIRGDEYHIDEVKCRRCKVCVTAKYLDGGCAMTNYLATNQ